ncbi:MAG: toprim domain-containing protein [Candidatus Moranbacteria bacterium]|nr:toprim domain-containing protein [Candidatus Moranbacteria bacterium]
MKLMPEIKDQCRGKWSSVLFAIGFPDQALNGKHQKCPFCNAGKDRFRWDKAKEFSYCNQCGPRQPMEMAMQWLNLPFKQTADLLRPTARTAKMTTIIPIDTKANEDRLRKIHGGLQKLHSSNAAGLYLIKRGLSTPPNNVFYHPGLPYYENGEKLGVFPAMVSRFQTAAGLTASYHITYLTEGGQKASVPTPKKFLPTVHDLAGGAIRLAEAGDALGIAEGIETGIALMAGEGLPVWATGSAWLMEKVQVPESVKRVVIAADNDKSFTGQASAYALARRLKSAGHDVRVINLLGDGSGIQAQWDAGLNLDYWDYRLLDTGHALRTVEQSFGTLARIDTQLAGAV